MTIIEPKKNKFRINFLTLLVGGFLLVEVLMSIFAYNRQVRLSYELDRGTARLQELLVANTELKDKLYSSLDLKNADKLAVQLGLVKERHPSYLTVR